MKNRFALALVLFLVWGAHAQKHAELPFYYPDQVQWPTVFTVDVHVMQCSKQDPRNFTVADTPLIHQFFDYVNQMYNTLEPPTLKLPNVPEFRESKIRFVLHKVHFHVDSLGWNAQWVEPGGFLNITRYDPATKTFTLKSKANLQRNYATPEGICLEYKDKRHVRLTFDSTYIKDGFACLRVKEKVDTAGISKLGVYRKRDDNCSDENYRRYAADDNKNIHVFLTQSSVSPIGFGCGPSKHYLNVTNAFGGAPWVTAQMLSHELGHCLGLNHTDSPQFPDLPKKDKFGWLNCDSVSVSNNIMGYNICRNYLSPMQIASVHQAFSHRQDYINLTLNRLYDERHRYDVGRNEDLVRNLVVNGDLVVRKGNTLTIRETLTLHERSKVILEDGAQVVVDGGSIVVMNNQTNANIVYCRKLGSSKKPKQKGKIITLNDGKIIGLQIP